MNHKKEVVLSRWVTDVSRASVESDDSVQATLSIERALPLWAEVRTPNRNAWVVGGRVSICIVCPDRDSAKQAA